VQAAEEESGKEGAPELPAEEELHAASLTVAQLQSELGKRALDTKWNPLKGKKELVDRLQVPPPPATSHPRCSSCSPKNGSCETLAGAPLPSPHPHHSGPCQKPS